MLTDNYILSTPHRPSIVEVSTLALIAVGLAWVITQVITLVAARWLLQNSKAESIQQKDEVVKHFDEQLESVKDDFTGFEGRFTEAYKTDMETISAEMNKIPERIKFTAMSEKGAEVRALQAYIDKEGGDVENALELAEGHIMEQDPQMMLRMALQKAVNAEVSDKYRKENPIKAGIWDYAKVGFASQIEQAFLGTSSLGPGRKKGNATNPYGL